MRAEWIAHERKLWDALQCVPAPRLDKYKLSQMSAKDRKKFLQDREKAAERQFAREWAAYREWVVHYPHATNNVPPR